MARRCLKAGRRLEGEAKRKRLEMARRRKEETLLRIEKRKNKLKLAQLGQDVWRMTYNMRLLRLTEKTLGVAVTSMSVSADSDRPTAESIAKGEEVTSVAGLSYKMSDLGFGVEGTGITSKPLAEITCSMTDLRLGEETLPLCLEECASDGRTDNLTSFTMNIGHAGELCAWTHSRACAWRRSRARLLTCQKDTNMIKTYNLTTVTGPAGTNSEEQVGRKQVVEAEVSMVVDMAGESQEMSLPFRRKTSPQVTENYVDTISGPSNQSSSQGELSVGQVVGQRRMAGMEVKEGVVATKSLLANSDSMVGVVMGSMVAERMRRFEPMKQPDETVTIVEMAEQSIGLGDSMIMMGEGLESSDRGAKPEKVVARKVVVAFRRNGKKVSTVCRRIEDFMENKVSSPFEGGGVRNSNINMGGKGENRTSANKRGRGE